MKEFYEPVAISAKERAQLAASRETLNERIRDFKASLEISIGADSAFRISDIMFHIVGYGDHRRFAQPNGIERHRLLMIIVENHISGFLANKIIDLSSEERLEVFKIQAEIVELYGF